MRPVPERRDHKRDETKRRLYETALVLFRRDGAAAARVDEIIRTAGVSRGTFYFHFPTKEHVLLSLSMEREAHIAQAIADVPADAPLPVVLDAAVAALTTAWEHDRLLFPEVASTMLRMPGIVSDPVRLGVRTALASRFRTAADRGELAPQLPAEILSDLYLASVMGGMLGWCGYPVVPLAVVLATVNQLFLDGASARRASPDAAASAPISRSTPAPATARRRAARR